eukprot:366021-Chlamydomonas_euryale.AAC.17
MRQVNDTRQRRVRTSLWLQVAKLFGCCWPPNPTSHVASPLLLTGGAQSAGRHAHHGRGCPMACMTKREKCVRPQVWTPTRTNRPANAHQWAAAAISRPRQHATPRPHLPSHIQRRGDIRSRSTPGKRPHLARLEAGDHHRLDV